MTDIVDQITKLLQLQKIDSNSDFAFIEKKLKVKPSALILAIIIFLLIVTLISNATNLVVAIGCCCVPAYFTFIAFQSKKQEVLHKYLIYWIIYAIMEVVSPILLFVLSSTLYVLLRIAITLALLHPESDFGLKLFHDFISPILTQHEQQIDQNIQNVFDKGKNVFEKGKDFFNQNIKKLS